MASMEHGSEMQEQQYKLDSRRSRNVMTLMLDDNEYDDE
jgi:hypothetical protein